MQNAEYEHSELYFVEEQNMKCYLASSNHQNEVVNRQRTLNQITYERCEKLKKKDSIWRSGQEEKITINNSSVVMNGKHQQLRHRDDSTWLQPAEVLKGGLATGGCDTEAESGDSGL